MNEQGDLQTTPSQTDRLINCGPGAHSVLTPDLPVTGRCAEGWQCLCSSDVDVLICLAKSAVRQSDALATAAFASSSLRAQVDQALIRLGRNTEMKELA
jgi:hypothetical protein